MDRAAAVKARLDEVKSVALGAMEVGPPCLECRYKRFGTCRNPAYSEPSFDPALGTFTEKFETSLSKARAEDGLCGPEGLLFEPQFPAIEVAKAFGGGLKIAWLIATAIIFGITLLAMIY